MLFLQNINYIHPNREPLFAGLNLTVNKQDKVALIGNNGAGKSTLLKMMAGELQPAGGLVRSESVPYCVPQLSGEFDDFTISQALRIEPKISALRQILSGDLTEENVAILQDDWAIESRCQEAFRYWHLGDPDLTQKMNTLSGGQKTKVFLAGIQINQPDIVLLDEPSNHLDSEGRQILYDYVKSTKNTLVVVSHDRTLLNLLDSVLELSKKGITSYGGNYDFYAQQKDVEKEALDQNLKSKEKALRKAREIERESLEREQKLDARGKKKQEKAGLPTISMNTLRNNAERSTSRMKGVHDEKVNSIANELSQLRTVLPDVGKMKMDLEQTALHNGKILVTAENVNCHYGGQFLWGKGLDFQIVSGERIAVKGVNGSGKTTLLKMILGQIQPQQGTIDRAAVTTIYIDQNYSLIDDGMTVYDQAQNFNLHGLPEHEIKIRLNRFLFTSSYWDKPCKTLSGGEKMRLTLCALTIKSQAPDIIVLDEPTNNLDIQNVEILTSAIQKYAGTLLVISHDPFFLNQINVQRVIEL